MQPLLIIKEFLIYSAYIKALYLLLPVVNVIIIANKHFIVSPTFITTNMFVSLNIYICYLNCNELYIFLIYPAVITDYFFNLLMI